MHPQRDHNGNRSHDILNKINIRSVVNSVEREQKELNSAELSGSLTLRGQTASN